MIDHMNLPVSDTAAARRFYDKVLGALGVARLAEDGDAVGYGTDLWAFGLVPATAPIEPLHIAFKAQSQAKVDAFFEAAVSSGGVSNGAPGPRAEYGERYYACFIIDPDGHNIEAVCRA